MEIILKQVGILGYVFICVLFWVGLFGFCGIIVIVLRKNWKWFDLYIEKKNPPKYLYDDSRKKYIHIGNGEYVLSKPHDVRRYSLKTLKDIGATTNPPKTSW